MGLFRRATPIDRAEVARMKSEITSLREALERHGSSTFALQSRVDELVTRTEAPDQAERIEQLGSRVDELAAAGPANDTTAQLDELAGQLAALDARVTAVSTELANQLSELGGEIETLSNRPVADGVGEVELGEIRDGQTRLANEQARYQIAFREDLARLAEQLRRPSA